MVECNLAKIKVKGSNLFICFCISGRVGYMTSVSKTIVFQNKNKYRVFQFHLTLCPCKRLNNING